MSVTNTSNLVQYTITSAPTTKTVYAYDNRLSALTDIVVKETTQTAALTDVTVNRTTDTFTKTSHGLSDGDVVVFNGTAIDGFTADTDYYVINKTADTFQLSATSGGSLVDATGSGTVAVTTLERGGAQPLVRTLANVTDYTITATYDGTLITSVNISPTTDALNAGKFATTSTITIYRETDFQQGSNYEPNAIIPADTLEGNLDKLTMMAQQLRSDIGRSVRFAESVVGAPDPEITLTAAQRANKLLGFNADGTEFAVTQEIGNYRGDWAVNVDYSVRDIVKESSEASILNNIYICKSSHTATGAYVTQYDSAKWDLIVDAAAAASSASAAADDADDAEKLAITAEDTQYILSDGVTTGYSALHYAAKAADSATDAENAKTDAETAKGLAETAQAAAEGALTTIQGFYLGAQASDPSVDGNGSAVTAGDWYFNTSSNTTRIYNGTSWNIIEALPQALDTTDSPTFATVNATTVDSTNLQVTNIKAKDGTSAGSIADSTGVVTLASSVLTTADINGGNIDNTTIGGTTPAAGTFTEINATTIHADYVYASNVLSGGSFTWDSGTSSPYASVSVNPPVVTSIHQGMRRCILNDSGVVQYYLDANDSTKKADGTAANLDGTDGQVMVEIPKFFYRKTTSGTETTWSISQFLIGGYTVHPAFIKDGVEVDFRYIGAYDACVYDDSATSYISGLNLDDNTGNIDSTNDKLASVSGVYPMVGLTRDEFRTIAANRGTGWRQMDFTLWSAVQMLYLVEYQTFYSQSVLGEGNVNDSYFTNSSNQNDSPHTVAGASNTLFGNASTDGSQPSAGAKPGTAYMSYRGIENFYGNCWTWADGVNINVSGGTADGWAVTNDAANFADDTEAGHTVITTAMPADGYVTNFSTGTDYAFIPSSTGGSATTYATDYFYDDNNNTNRVLPVGGSANDGVGAGAFYVPAVYGSSAADRNVGGRLAF